MEERSYKELRQEVKNDLIQMYGGAVLLTLEQCMKVYGLSDRKAAKKVIGAPRVPGERRVLYYIGDIASDIAKRRVGNVRGQTKGKPRANKGQSEGSPRADKGQQKNKAITISH